MYIHVCISVCISVCVYPCVYIRVCISMCVHVCVCVHPCVYIHVCICACVLYVCISMGMHACVYACVYICVFSGISAACLPLPSLARATIHVLRCAAYVTNCQGPVQSITMPTQITSDSEYRGQPPKPKFQNDSPDSITLKSTTYKHTHTSWSWSW